MTNPVTSQSKAKAGDERETRALSPDIELRAQDDGKGERVAAGYAVLYGAQTNIGDMWVEEFREGAFTKSLQNRDVIAIHSHEFARIVGRMKAGTLDIREDRKGLAFENRLPDTTDGRDLAVLLERGDIAGMSFGFRATVQEWDDTSDPPTRTIIEAELYEITYTAIPQYDQTEVGLRSLEAVRDERREHNANHAAARIARRMRMQHAERKL